MALKVEEVLTRKTTHPTSLSAGRNVLQNEPSAAQVGCNASSFIIDALLFT